MKSLFLAMFTNHGYKEPYKKTRLMTLDLVIFPGYKNRQQKYKNRQMGLHENLKLLFIRGHSQKNENTNVMEEHICNPFI
jgi:hypothetical protein